jgi:hypothetical protein
MDIFPVVYAPTNHLRVEFELVQNAMFTLPEDQSAWLYHRWLIGSGRSRLSCYFNDLWT